MDKTINDYELYGYKKQIHIIIYDNDKINICDSEWNKINRYYISSINFLMSSSLFNPHNISYNDVNNDYSFYSQNSLSTTNSKIIKKNIETNENKSINSFYSILLYSISYSKINKIIETDLSYMFYECSSLISISGLSKLNISNIINLAGMFENCYSLVEINDIF
jgi:surface protein